MNKVTTMSTFPILQYDADTLKRQNGFQLYIRALQNVLMNIHKLSTVLIQFPTIQSVTDESAQRALFSFVQSTVSPGYYAHLDLFVKEYGSHDGCAALRLLQNLCLSQDPTLQQMALRTYEHLSLGEDQKIISFNQHFNRAYSLVTARGIELEQKEQLRAYLNAVGGTHNAQLSGIIALYRHHFLSDNLHMSVYELQTLLQQEEEQIAMQERMNSRPMTTQHVQPIRSRRSSANSIVSASSTITSQHRPNGNSTRSQNQQSKSKKPFRSRKLVCWGCQEAGHALNKCPTTSPSDREQIVNEYRQSKLASQTSATVTPSTNATPNRNNGTALPSALKSLTKGVSYLNALQGTNKVSYLNAMALIAGLEEHEKLPKPPKGLVPIVDYVTDEVLIDSGATDDMCGHLSYLTNTRPCYASVILPDGSTIAVTQCGMMRV
jgi:hypothetical protein